MPPRRSQQPRIAVERRGGTDSRDHGRELLAQRFERGPHGAIAAIPVSAQRPVRRPLERTRGDRDLPSLEEGCAAPQSMSQGTNFLESGPWILPRTGEHRRECSEAYPVAPQSIVEGCAIELELLGGGDCRVGLAIRVSITLFHAFSPRGPGPSGACVVEALVRVMPRLSSRFARSTHQTGVLAAC
jgi:hypothetical protein